MQQAIELTIVMPCLNEAETLEACIVKAKSYLQRSGVEGEIVIGDNGSTDGSQAIATRLGARVIDVPLRGYGAALYAACRAAHGRYIVMGDSDDSYDFSDVGKFLDRLREGNDLVMGNRFTGEIKPGAMPWKNRYIGNPVLSWIGQTLFPSPLGDFHCGIRGFSKTAFEAMDLRTTGMEFASEMVIKATQKKMRLAEVPTTLSPDGRSSAAAPAPLPGRLAASSLHAALQPQLALPLPRPRPHDHLRRPGKLLVQGPVAIGTPTLNVNTLIYCAFFLLIGFQSVMFSLLSRIYAVQENLYPITDTYKKFFRLITLESGLLVGLTMSLFGFCLAIYTVTVWKRHAFGELDLFRVARIVIPAATSLALGIEIMLFSFFLSTLGLSIRHHDTSEIPS